MRFFVFLCQGPPCRVQVGVTSATCAVCPTVLSMASYPWTSVPCAVKGVSMDCDADLCCTPSSNQ